MYPIFKRVCQVKITAAQIQTPDLQVQKSGITREKNTQDYNNRAALEDTGSILD